MRIRMNKKTIISLALCIGVFFMAVGYSILMSELKIDGSASISSTWDIRITSIEEVSTSGSAYNIEEPSFTNDTAKFNVSLVNPGDAKSFEVVIQNKGTITAILNSMDITTSGNDAIIYEVDGLKDGDTIAKGETKRLNITVRYNSNVIGDPNDRYKRLKVGLEWVQYTNQSIDAKTYTIKYNNNGGSGSMDSTTCTVGQSCTLSTNTFTKDGVTFAGWATKSTGAVAYTDGQSVKNLTSANKNVTLYAVWSNKLMPAILSNNIPQSDSTIDFSKSSAEDGTKGLYYTNVNTEDSKTTYYFRGDVENNYVVLGRTHIEENKCVYTVDGSNESVYYRTDYSGEMTEELCLSTNVYAFYVPSFDIKSYYVGYASESECEEIMNGPSDSYCEALNEKAQMVVSSYFVYSSPLWRIVRINEDGSIRLISETNVGNSKFNNAGYHEAIGFMYGSSTSDNYKDTHANINDSEIKKYLDEWYTTNLSDYSNYLADAGFCNDRGLAPSAGLWESYDTALGYGSNMTCYGAYNRLENLHKPQFACPNPTNDLFTLKGSNKGNKALDNPIGLLTIDEVIYAGGNEETSNENYYLVNGGDWWTMSPNFSYTSITQARYVDSSGIGAIQGVEMELGVRPVINLKSTVEFTLEGTGDPGSSTNPYIIVTD